MKLTSITMGLMAVWAAALLCSGIASAQDRDVIASWVQYTATGVEVRAVSRYSCPLLSVDGVFIEMGVRAEPTAPHPNYVCASEVNSDVKALVLGGEKLPLPVKKQPKRIVVMGDTGCRLSEGHGLYQECNNDTLWPFAQVARSVRSVDPDLIIYTGDYIYRESPCPDGNQGCAGSPYGDNQATWEADWLLPAMPVQAAAPMILIRGNHETCARAGDGWFRYLDARPQPEQCQDSTEPWLVSFKSMQLGVMDVANIELDGEPLTALFAGQLHWLGNELNKPAWIAAHRPFWGYGADDDTGELTTPTQQLQDAVTLAGLPSQTRLLVGAHIHLAEVLDFGKVQPPQLVAANSGTQLVSRVAPPAAIDGVQIESQQVIYQYGFVVMDARGHDGWTMSFRDVQGRELERCRLRGKRVHCR